MYKNFLCEIQFIFIDLKYGFGWIENLNPFKSILLNNDTRGYNNYCSDLLIVLLLLHFKNIIQDFDKKHKIKLI